MKNLDKVKEIICVPIPEEDIIELLLFRGSMSIGQARSKLNFINALYVAEIPNVTEAIKISKQDDGIAHLCGMHSTFSPMMFRTFCGRVMKSPNILKRYAYLDEYIEWITKGYYFKLEPISRWTKSSHVKNNSHSFRYIPKDLRIRKARIFNETVIEMPEYYPYLSSNPIDDANLLITVHNAVPLTIPQSHRGDICQDLIVAVLESNIKLEDLDRHVPDFIKQCYRKYPTKYRALSLDKAISSEDNRTLGELISEDNILNHW